MNSVAWLVNFMTYLGSPVVGSLLDIFPTTAVSKPNC